MKILYTKYGIFSYCYLKHAYYLKQKLWQTLNQHRKSKTYFVTYLLIRFYSIKANTIENLRTLQMKSFNRNERNLQREESIREKVNVDLLNSRGTRARTFLLWLSRFSQSVTNAPIPPSPSNQVPADEIYRTRCLRRIKHNVHTDTLVKHYRCVREPATRGSSPTRALTMFEYLSI